jgi:hypothetical protein
MRLNQDAPCHRKGRGIRRSRLVGQEARTGGAELEFRRVEPERREGVRSDLVAELAAANERTLVLDRLLAQAGNCLAQETPPVPGGDHGCAPRYADDLSLAFAVEAR